MITHKDFNAFLEANPLLEHVSAVKYSIETYDYTHVPGVRLPVTSVRLRGELSHGELTAIWDIPQKEAKEHLPDLYEWCSLKELIEEDKERAE